MFMDTKKLLIIAIIIVVIALTVVLTLFSREILSVKKEVETDRSREQPLVGGKVSINVLNITNTENATHATTT